MKSNTIKNIPMGILFVDLMASTFAVIFLVLIISVLHGKEEISENTFKKITTDTSDDYKIEELNLTGSNEWDDGIKHPYVEYYNHENDFIGYIDLHNEFIEFTKEKNSPTTKEKSADFLNKKSLLRDYLKNLKEKTGYIVLTIYGTANVYFIIELMKEYNLKWMINYYSWDSEENNNENTNKTAQTDNVNNPSNDNNVNNYLTSTTRESSEQNIQNALKSISEENNFQNTSTTSNPQLFLYIWEYLTQKIYIENGYNINYESHRHELIFFQEDVRKYFGQPTEKRQNKYALFLVLCLLFGYLFREFTLSGNGNHL